MGNISVTHQLMNEGKRIGFIIEYNNRKLILNNDEIRRCIQKNYDIGITENGRGFKLKDGRKISDLPTVSYKKLIENRNKSIKFTKINNKNNTSIPRNNYRGVRIYTKQEYKNKCYCISNDIMFEDICYNDIYTVLDVIRYNKKYLEDIDGITNIDEKTLTVSTKIGNCSLLQISTGLKTLINILYLLRVAKMNGEIIINANECGENALYHIFNIVNNSNISLYITYPVLSMPENLEYYVDNIKVNNCEEFIEYIYKNGVSI